MSPVTNRLNKAFKSPFPDCKPFLEQKSSYQSTLKGFLNDHSPKPNKSEKANLDGGGLKKTSDKNTHDLSRSNEVDNSGASKGPDAADQLRRS